MPSPEPDEQVQPRRGARPGAVREGTVGARPAGEWLVLAGGPRRVVLATLASSVLSALWAVFDHAGRGGVVTGMGTWLFLTTVMLAARVRSRSTLATGLLIALPMAVLRVAGAHFTADDSPPYTDFGLAWPVELVADWAVLGAVAVVVLAALRRRRPPVRAVGPEKWGRTIGRAAAGMLVCWSFWLLVFFPGIMTRDSWSSVFMGTGRWPMTNHHPVMFSVWVGMCMRLAGLFGGGTTAGVLVFSVLQVLLMAGSLGVVVAWVGHRAGRWPARATLAFFALSPTVGSWSVTMQKDSMFVVWMTLLCCFLFEVAHRGPDWAARRRPLAMLVVLLVLVSFSRNNGPYVAAAVVGWLAVLSVLRRWRGRRQAAPARWWLVPLVGIVCLVAVMGVQGPGYRAAGVAPSEYAESVGLPLQQVAWAVRYGRTTPAQRAEVSQLMPVDAMRSVYSPTLSDNVKFDKRFNKDWLAGHHAAFWSMWADLLPSNASGYAKAWFALCGRYADPEPVLTRFDPGTKNGSFDLVVHDRNLLAWVLHARPNQVTAWGSAASVLPPWSLAYCAPGLFWLCLLFVAASFLQRRPAALLPVIPFVVLMLTLLVAAPATDFRYAATGHFALPVLLLALWCGPRLATEEWHRGIILGP